MSSTVESLPHRRVRLGTIEPAPAGGTWRERLETLLTSYTAMLFEHPSLARAALAARPRG